MGQTARKFSQRIGEHRRVYEKCIGKIIDDDASDEYALRLHVQRFHGDSLLLGFSDVFMVSFLQGLSTIRDIHICEDRWASKLIPDINKQAMVTKLYK